MTIPTPDDAGPMADFQCRNREHFAPWDPERAEEFFTEAWWRERLGDAHDEFQSDKSLRLVLRPLAEPDGPIIGTINFSNFVRGVFHACYLGYCIDAEREGQGLMHEGLTRSIAYVFDELRLHRIMANYMPHNQRSGKLLRKLGFVAEGYARDYLHIAGAWRDHVLTSLTNPTM